MSAILSVGDKIHVIHRQLFESDVRRHFVGTVEACDGSLARVKGYLFTMRMPGGEFAKHDPILRTRIIALDSGMLLINVLPAHVDIEKITYEHQGPQHILVTDGSDWALDLSHL
jgi:hypothetical protein